MIKVLSFLSNEICFAGHSRGPCGPRFEHHCTKVMVHCICTYDTQLWYFAFVTLLPTDRLRVIKKFSS